MITKTKRNDSEVIFENPVAQIFEDVDNEAAGKNKEPEGDRYDALAKQLADLQTRLSESEKTNMALLSTPQWKSQTNDTFTEVKPESVALPDPALDPEGFDKAQGERQRIRYDNQRRRDEFNAKQERSVQDKVDSLWDEFGSRYPDMAEDKDRIDFVSTKVAQAALKRGVDVERYMFVTRDKFLEDVAAKYEEVFGTSEGNENENDLDDAPRSRRSEARTSTRTRANRRNRQEDEYVGRTAGVFGGAESGGRPTRGAEEDTGPTMIDDIQAIQRRTGFF